MIRSTMQGGLHQQKLTQAKATVVMGVTTGEVTLTTVAVVTTAEEGMTEEVTLVEAEVILVAAATDLSECLI